MTDARFNNEFENENQKNNNDEINEEMNFADQQAAVDEQADDDEYAFSSDAVDSEDDEYYESDWENEIRLDKIDEIMKRTKLSFVEAKEYLELFDYDIVEALAAIDEEHRAYVEEAKQKLRERYYEAKDFSKEKYEDFKDFGKDKYADFKDFGKEKYTEIKDGAVKDEAGKAYQKVKDVISTPVEITKSGKKVPAGILGAGVVSLLYPLHRSKALAAAGLGAIGAWAIAKQKNNEELKSNIKSAVDVFGQNFADSFNGLTGDGDDENCFTIKVDDAYQPKKNNAQADGAQDAPHDCGCGCDGDDQAAEQTDEKADNKSDKAE